MFKEEGQLFLFESKKIRPLLSVIIVNYNGGNLLTISVQSVLSNDFPLELFVVDNASSDNSIQELQKQVGNDKRLILIQNEQNLGFSAANNIALQQSQGKYVLILNPDCIVGLDTIEHMIQALENSPQAGMAGCLIRNTDGTEQAGCRRTIPTPWRTLVRVLHLNQLFPDQPIFRSFVLNQTPLPNEPVFVEAISGAFMLLRRETINQIGLMDEGYFLHCEDLDWCMRILQKGKKILFVSTTEVIHHQGECSKRTPIKVSWHKHKGMVRFYRKFFRHQYPIPLMLAVAISVWIRFFIVATRELFRKKK